MIEEEASTAEAKNTTDLKSRYAIVARGVGKAYYPSASPATALMDVLTGRPSQSQPFWALHPLDLEIERGEVLGLVGHNGAGKSTLLQILSGTLSPSTGDLMVNGRVAALLELGAGFNPEFTGRENLLLNGPLLGLTRTELADRLQDIIDFSGIGEFIEQPVKTYSSGMFVRLAFSLATSVDPDILVIDEALSVGDGEFSRKSFDRIISLRDSGATILFCSHSMYQIESLCSRALWLDHGRARQLGRPADVTSAYQEHLDTLAAPPGSAQADLPVVTSPGHARLKTLLLTCDGVEGNPAHAVSGQSRIEISLGFESDPSLDSPNAAITINGADGKILASSGTWIDAVPLQRNKAGQGTAMISFAALPLLKGSYTISAYLFCERGLHIYSAAERFAELRVKQNHQEQGVVSLPHQWHACTGLPKRVLSHAVADESPSLTLPPGWSDQWSTRWSTALDLGGLHGLFEQAFSKPIPASRWNWKYQQAQTWGIAVLRDKEFAGFFGGMPRAMVHAGCSVQAVQIGDVMVKPSERGVLTRRGPLFRAAAAYFSNMRTLYPEAQFAYGFPSQRHFGLGIKLGLYAPADAMAQLTWKPLTPARHWLTMTRSIHNVMTGTDMHKLNALWTAMQRDWPNLTLPIRDPARWHYRYACHPVHTYQLLMVSARLSGRPLAAAVLRVHPDHLEWLDFVGGCDGIAAATRAVRMRAAELSLPEVRGWFSTAPAAIFASDARQDATEIQVPVDLWGNATDGPLRPPAPLWLMAGDTDFR
jgi:ABC-type polysaccharide/polyol phosphate transport system ATPase subunit